jgi:hypothetical protein
MAGTTRGRKRLKTDSFSVFEKNVKRSRAFIRVFEGTETARKQGRPTSDEVDLLRGALVFSVGALDNFVTELILELVPKFGGSSEAMRQPLTEIAKAEPSLALRVAMAATKDNGEQEFKTALGNWLETKTFHGVKKVMGALTYIGVAMDESTVPTDWKKSLDDYTDWRHAIVHRGDTSTVKLEQAQECTDLIEEIGKSINRAAVKLYH